MPERRAASHQPVPDSRPVAATAVVGGGGREAWLDGGGVTAQAFPALIQAADGATDAPADPTDVHAVLSALAQLAGQLPQALLQLLDLIGAEYATGTLEVVQGLDVGVSAAAVTDLSRQLCWAATSARALHAALDQAQATFAWAASAHSG